MMKAAIKRLGRAVLNSAPVYGVLKRRALAENPLTILCYHTLRRDDETLDAWLALGMGDFRQQIAVLRKTYDIVSLDDALEPKGSTARPRAVLTFDDGEWGMHEHLLPFVEAEQLPVTVYVATGQIETGRAYWFDRVMNALQQADLIEIDMRAAGLSSWAVGPERGKERWAQIGEVLAALKNAPPEDRDRLADEIIGQTPAIETNFTPLAPMTIPQLQKLAAHPFVTIGAHSHCHNLLDQISLPEASASIAKSRALLQEWTDQTVRHFAYPNGNYTPELMAEIERLGFASATILDERLVTQNDPKMALPRISVGRYDHLSRFRLRLVNI